MSFQLATAFVELQSRGYGQLLDQITGINSQLTNLSQTRIGVIQNLASQFVDASVAASLVGTIAYTVGNLLGNWVFETDKWAASLDAARDKAKLLDSEILQVMHKAFSNKMQDIELIRNPDIKRQQYSKLLGDLNTEIEGVTRNVNRNRAEVERWNDTWKITGNQKAFAQQAVDDLQASQRRLDLLKLEREKVLDISGARAMEVEQRKLLNAEIDKSENNLVALREELKLLRANADERYKILAAQLAPAGIHRKEIEALLREKDAIREKANEEARAKAEKEAESRRAEDIRKAEARSITQAYESEKQRIQEQLIALNEGEEAAHAYRLEKSGIPKEQAKELARQQAIIDAQKEGTKEVEKQRTSFSSLADLADKMQQELFGRQTGEAGGAAAIAKKAGGPRGIDAIANGGGQQVVQNQAAGALGINNREVGEILSLLRSGSLQVVSVAGDRPVTIPNESVRFGAAPAGA